jgi:hypothetical protein
MSGKSYYLFGAYPMLFAAGGFGFERWIKNSYILRGLVIALLTIPNLLLLPMLLPVLPLNQTLGFFAYCKNNVPAFNFVVTWEDQKLHPITQDYADMLGWDELSKKVADTYNSLTPDQQKHTVIIADNYGEAGAIHHFGKQYDLPEIISLDSSFGLWAPMEVGNVQYVIFIDCDDKDGKNAEKIGKTMESTQKTGAIENALAREVGTSVYLFTHPKPVFNEFYKKEYVRRVDEY